MARAGRLDWEGVARLADLSRLEAQKNRLDASTHGFRAKRNYLDNEIAVVHGRAVQAKEGKEFQLRAAARFEAKLERRGINNE